MFLEYYILEILLFFKVRTAFWVQYFILMTFCIISCKFLCASSLKSVSVIEKFTENVRFCIICNYLSKIIPALQSRCTRFRFAPLTPEQILPRLEYVIEQETLVFLWKRLCYGIDYWTTDFYYVCQHVVSRTWGTLSASTHICLQGVVLGHKAFTQSLCFWCYSVVSLIGTFVFLKHKNDTNWIFFLKRTDFLQF